MRSFSLTNTLFFASDFTSLIKLYGGLRSSAASGRVKIVTPSSNRVKTGSGVVPGTSPWTVFWPKADL